MIQNKRYVFVFSGIVAFIIVFVSCKKLLPPEPESNQIIEGLVAGLTPQQQKNFMVGDELFGKNFSKEEGLGPIFINTSCAGCHIGDGKGHPFSMVTRFGKQEGSTFNYLLEKGGPQLQKRSIAGYEGEQIPSDATHSTKRIPPIVTGLGLLAALHDSTILYYADSADVNLDGISGRPSYIEWKGFTMPSNIHISNNGKYIGRFGKKVTEITILDQVVFALKNDIGITSDFDTEDLYNTSLGINTGDEVDDPEVSASVVHNLVFYMRTLKAPERRNTNDPDVQAGEKLFHSIKCISCHIPDLTTAKSDIEALSEKTIHPYTDLLLHDMGTVLDEGFPEGNAQSYEWRTAPLWGLGLAISTQGTEIYLLHDGRAKSIEETISYHSGEAESIRNVYFSLTKEEQQQIIKFLESL